MKYDELYPNCHSKLRSVELGNAESACSHPTQCRQLPGTILRIFIPGGAVINYLNLIELTSPSGICLILRSPILGTIFSGKSGDTDYSRLLSSIKQAGGTVEVVN